MRRRSTVTVGDDPTMVADSRIGLRFVRVRNGKLYLNGHLLDLRGASIQEDLPGRGPALRDEDVTTIVNDLVRLGAYRPGADPQADRALRLATRVESLLVQPRSDAAGDPTAAASFDLLRATLDDDHGA